MAQARMTVFDQQSGKLVSGEVKNLTALSFELWNEGERIGVFSRDNLPRDFVPSNHEVTPLQGKEEAKT